jgi:hypothetical protein
VKLQLLGSLILLLALHYPAPAAETREFTSSLSAGELLERCRQATDILNEETRQSSLGRLAQAAYCAGFVEAAADAGSFLGVLNVTVRQPDGAQLPHRIRNCAGPAVRGEELLELVVQFLEDNPESRQQAAVSASMFAIARAFPCDARA